MAGQDVGVLGQGGELAGEGRLAVLAAGEAGLGLAPALLGLAQLAAAGRTDLLGPPFDPEALAAVLAALGAVAADVEDVLPRSCRCALANVTLRGDLPCVATASLWGASPATPVGAPKARGRGPQATAKVRVAVLTGSSPAAREHLRRRWQSAGEHHSQVPLSQGSAGPVVLLPLRRRAAPFAQSRSAQRRRRQRRRWKFLPSDGRTEQQVMLPVSCRGGIAVCLPRRMSGTCALHARLASRRLFETGR